MDAGRDDHVMVRRARAMLTGSDQRFKTWWDIAKEHNRSPFSCLTRFVMLTDGAGRRDALVAQAIDSALSRLGPRPAAVAIAVEDATGAVCTIRDVAERTRRQHHAVASEWTVRDDVELALTVMAFGRGGLQCAIAAAAPAARLRHIRDALLAVLSDAPPNEGIVWDAIRTEALTRALGRHSLDKMTSVSRLLGCSPGDLRRKRARDAFVRRIEKQRADREYVLPSALRRNHVELQRPEVFVSVAEATEVSLRGEAQWIPALISSTSFSETPMIENDMTLVSANDSHVDDKIGWRPSVYGIGPSRRHIPSLGPSLATHRAWRMLQRVTQSNDDIGEGAEVTPASWSSIATEDLTATVVALFSHTVAL